MPNTTKSIVDRLVDGLEDYCLDRESFDARYVCGQLFLHGQASAFNIGMPGRFYGEDDVRIGYIYNWYANLWTKTVHRYNELVGPYRLYDTFKNANVIKLANIYRVINLQEYVESLTKVVETQTFIMLRTDSYLANTKRIQELLNGAVELSYKPAADVVVNAGEEVTAAIERLKADYTGSSLYPSATLTFFSVSDQLNNLMRAFVGIATLPGLLTGKKQWAANDVSLLLPKAFPETKLKELAEHHVHELLVLTLTNLELITEIILYVNNAVQLLNKTVDNLTSNPNEKL
jgi:hypothetical protein